MSKFIFCKMYHIFYQDFESALVLRLTMKISIMLRTPQYTTDQRIFMVNRRTKGDSKSWYIYMVHFAKYEFGEIII